MAGVHGGQNHSSTGISLKGGLRHSMWYLRTNDTQSNFTRACKFPDQANSPFLQKHCAFFLPCHCCQCSVTMTGEQHFYVKVLSICQACLLLPPLQFGLISGNSRGRKKQTELPSRFTFCSITTPCFKVVEMPTPVSSDLPR